MPRFLTISEARKQLLELDETLEILSEPSFVADLRESLRQAERGEILSLEDVRAQLLNATETNVP